MSLKVNPTKAEIKLSLPKRFNYDQALHFLVDQKPWLDTQRAKAAQKTNFGPDMSITIYGQVYRLIHDPKSIRPLLDLNNNQILCGGDQALFSTRITRALKAFALEKATLRTQSYAKDLGFSGVTIRLFDAQTRWGSCTPKRATIRIHWRLIFAPPEVFDYVCAHEASHLLHPDHSQRFWGTVSGIMPHYRTHQNWLKIHGAKLHLIG
jgi:predicted metal-dependent hydrolase